MGRGARRRVPLANNVAVASWLQWWLRRVAARTRASPAVCYHASEALDRERFEAGALSESETREPRRRSEVDRVCRARRPANLKTCKQVRAKYFYEACPSATRADATGVKAPARHPSQCSDPRFRCSMGDVSSTIASSTLPPGRLIVRVL